MPKKELKMLLEEKTIQLLDRLAAVKGMNRSDLLGLLLRTEGIREGLKLTEES